MEESQVKLHGFWSSSFVYKVIWALKLKGVEYDYTEEDLSNKSQSLLEFNPIHKKVPVLVHNGRPLAESAVILQYIDEVWPDRHPLLPSDPYDRAMARFWVRFEEQMNPIFYEFFRASDGNKEEAAKQAFETLKIIEDRALHDRKFFGGDRIGMVDLSFGWLAHWFDCIEEVVGMKILKASTLPRLYQWTMNFKEEPVIKDNLPDVKKLMAHSKRVRERITLPKSK